MDELEPPPNAVSTFEWRWRNWLHNLYEFSRDNMSRDFMLDVAAGRVTGHSAVNKFGGAIVSSGTEEDVWDGSGTYSFPTTALMTSMSQTTDQVAMRNGTIEVTGLDANWDEVTQNIDLDGTNTTTAVTLTTALIRCYRMRVLEDVVTTSAVRVHNVGETTDYAIIKTGNNQTLMAIYTVPANKTAYITSWYADYVRSASKDPNGVEFRAWVADRGNSYEFQIRQAKGVPKQAGGFQEFFNPYNKILEKSDIKVTAEPDAADSDVHAGFDIILVDNQ